MKADYRANGMSDELGIQGRVQAVQHDLRSVQ
jgi:hypothetical protein